MTTRRPTFLSPPVSDRGSHRSPARSLRLLRGVRRRARRLGPEVTARAAGVRAMLPPRVRGVALTFDDGPDAEFTPRVLDILADLDVPATFFLMGERACANPELVRRMVRDGHALGSHSQTHPDPWRLSQAALVREYRDGRRAVERVAGRPVPLFRPPKGHVDARGAVAMRVSGVRPWLWSIDPADWAPGATAAGIVDGARAMAPGDVVLLHDALGGPDTPPAALDRGATVEALPSIVDFARRQGLALVTLY